MTPRGQELDSGKHFVATNALEFDRRLQLARDAALEAGALVMRYFQQPDLAVEKKSDDSPVTKADREAEQLLRERIAEKFPDDAVLGEEFGEAAGTSGFKWILDPVDGTKSFVAGVPLFGTLIGVEHDGECVAGVVSLPALGETVYAAIGQGAWHVRGDEAPRPARVSSCRDLSDAVFCTTAIESFLQVPRGKAVLDSLVAATRLTRTWGDCYGYVLVATGRADVMIDPLINPWDAAPLVPILKEAGGTFTDWQGADSIYNSDAVATNGQLYDAVLAIMRE